MDKKAMLAPTIVLVCICLVASMLLAATYQITKPIIDDINIRMANESRAEVLPEADGFTHSYSMIAYFTFVCTWNDPDYSNLFPDH